MDALPADVLVALLASSCCACPPVLSARDLAAVACAARAFGQARPASLRGLTVAEAAAAEAVARLLAPCAPPALARGETVTRLLAWAQGVACGAAGAGGARLPLPLAAAGTFHSLLVDACGRLRRCGAWSPLPAAVTDLRGGAADELRPQPVAGAPGPPVRFVAVAAASHHNLALDSLGAVYAFGRAHAHSPPYVAGPFAPLTPGGDAHPDTGVPRPLRGALRGLRVVAVAAGDHHSACVTSTGVVFTWGRGEWGRLGHGNEADVPAPRLLQLDEPAVGVAAANAHTAIVTLSGGLLTCGYGRFGRLGHGDEKPRLAPTRVAALSAERIVACAAADDHTAATAESGALFTFGYGGFGQLAHGFAAGGGALGAPGAPICRLVPTRVAAGALQGACVVAAAAGGYHTVALDAAGGVHTAGWAAYGSLGRPAASPHGAPGVHGDAAAPAAAAADPSPARVSGGALGTPGVPVAQVAAGCHHTLCVTRDGRLVAFGRGAGGRLGHGSEDDALLPVEIQGVTLPRCGDAPPHILLPSAAKRQAKEEDTLGPASTRREE